MKNLTVKTILATFALALPMATIAAPQTIDNLEQVTYKSAPTDKCNAEFLNKKYRTKVIAKKKLMYPYFANNQSFTLNTVAMNELPVACNGNNSIVYIGNPLLGGVWVDSKDEGIANAKWQEHLKMFGQDKWSFRVLDK